MAEALEPSTPWQPVGSPSELGERYGNNTARIWREAQEQHGGALLGIIERFTPSRRLLVAGHDNQPAYSVKIDTRYDSRRQLSGHNVRLLEGAALRAIADLTEPPVQVPQYMSDGEDYLVTSWTPGRVFSFTELTTTFADEELALFGTDLAAVIGWNSRLSLTTFFEARKALASHQDTFEGIPVVSGDYREFHPSLTIFDRHTRWVQDFGGENGPAELKRLGFEQLSEIVAWEAEANEECMFACMRGRFWGHNDLRYANMTFEQRDNKWRLAGVFDWGATAASTVEREARHIIAFGAIATNALCEGLKSYYTRPALDHIRLWSLAQIVTGLIRRPASVPWPEAAATIQNLYPECDWAELAPLRTDVTDAQLAEMRAQFPQVAW